MTPAEQIAGYLKLTSAHFYLNSRHASQPCLGFRSELVAEMDFHTYSVARRLQELLEGHYEGIGFPFEVVA